MCFLIFAKYFQDLFEGETPSFHHNQSRMSRLLSFPKSEGLVETVETLQQAAISFSGAGVCLAAAAAPAVLTRKGRAVAIFSFTDHPCEWAATETRPVRKELSPYTRITLFVLGLC